MYSPPPCGTTHSVQRPECCVKLKRNSRSFIAQPGIEMVLVGKPDGWNRPQDNRWSCAEVWEPTQRQCTHFCCGLVAGLLLISLFYLVSWDEICNSDGELPPAPVWIHPTRGLKLDFNLAVLVLLSVRTFSVTKVGEVSTTVCSKPHKLW